MPVANGYQTRQPHHSDQPVLLAHVQTVRTYGFAVLPSSGRDSGNRCLLMCGMGEVDLTCPSPLPAGTAPTRNAELVDAEDSADQLGTVLLHCVSAQALSKSSCPEESRATAHGELWRTSRYPRLVELAAAHR